MIWGPEHWSALANSVMAVAAAGGAIAAFRGLSTWKTQIRWEQGRGLSVRLLQTFGNAQRLISRVFEFPRPSTDFLAALTASEAKHEAFLERMDGYKGELRSEIDAFEMLCAEAFLVWGEPFREITIPLREIERSIVILLHDTQKALDPSGFDSQRVRDAESANELWDDAWGVNPEVRGLSGKAAQLRLGLENRLQEMQLR